MAVRFLRIPVLGLLAALLSAPLVAAQSYHPPLTPDGHPDLDGAWRNPPRGAMLEKGLMGDPLTISADEAAARIKAMNERMFSNPALKLQPDLPPFGVMTVRGEARTRQIVEPADGLLPYTPAALRALQAWTAAYDLSRSGAPIANPEDADIQQRCLASEGQPPMHLSYDQGLRQIVQTPTAIAIHSEFMNEVRIVRIGGALQPAAIRSLWGDSVGHWEGETLVVETRNFDLTYPFHVGLGERPIMVGPDSLLIERFRRVSASELDYSFTIIDPAIYARPWLAEYALTRSPDHPAEYACHEGNYAQTHILQASRDIEASQLAKK